MDINFDKEFGRNIIGVDEAGRGPLAGPVVAAAVYIKKISESFLELNDSKKLTDKKRRKLYNELINSNDIVYGVGIVEANVIDDINILNATFLAMRKALENINLNLDDYLLLVDGNHKIREYNYEQIPVIKGDSKSMSIAAASVIAKVTRDIIMERLEEDTPGYNFDQHKGYGTKLHYQKIDELGISVNHRRTFLKKVLK